MQYWLPRIRDTAHKIFPPEDPGLSLQMRKEFRFGVQELCVTKR